MSKQTAKTARTDGERTARQTVIEELFYDFNRSRRQIYWLNFVRGVFFGVGSILGGTLILALVLSLLGLLVDLPGGVGDFIQYVVNTVQRQTPAN